MTDPLPDPLPAAKPAAPWWALNSYVLLVAGLSILSGVEAIVAGPAGPPGWVFRVGLVLAGVGIIHGVVTRHTIIEAAAGALLVASSLVKWTVELLATYPPAIDWGTVFVQTLVMACVSLRVWSLVRGGVSIIPPWKAP